MDRVMTSKDQCYQTNSTITINKSNTHQSKTYSCRVRHASLLEPLQEEFHFNKTESSIKYTLAVPIVLSVFVLIPITIYGMKKYRKKGYTDTEASGEPSSKTEAVKNIHGEFSETNTWYTEDEKPLLGSESNRTRTPSFSKNSHNDDNTGPLREFLLMLGFENSRTSKLSHREHLQAETGKKFDIGILKDVAWHILHKIMALNSTARSINLDNTKETEDDGEFTVENVFDDTEESNSLHALDVICALLHCSDHFFQQEIITKMSMCQFAVPILLPAGKGYHCTFMLWTLRGIVKRWKSQYLSENGELVEDSLVNKSTPIFSFMRFGEYSISKSQILNQIISPEGQHHAFFIHRDMNGGNTKRKISDGLVELSWYFPAGSSLDLFPKPLYIANLRGDLQSNKTQTQFLKKISATVFIFVDNAEVASKHFTDIDISDANYFFIVSVHSEITKRSFKNFLEKLSQLKNNNYLFTVCKNSAGKKICEYLLKLFPDLMVKKRILVLVPNRSPDIQIAKKLQLIIKEQMTTELNCNTLEKLSNVAHETGIHIDEELKECKNARKLAEAITKDIKDVASYKKETMKLQGELWKRLATIEKKMIRMSKQNIMSEEEYKSKLRREIFNLRKQQSQQKLSDGMKQFLEALNCLSQLEIHYFLYWMRFYLDQLSRKNILQSHLQLHQDKSVGESITERNLGIEHFLRELGQFYEANDWMLKHGETLLSSNQFSRFPSIAADLLLDGFPLELIDGVASNIPIQWITDVFIELDTKSGGECRLKVVTVLGMENTGKSTLLKAMFGIGSVAKGGCTRGAFMTLCKVPKNFQGELGCHFILLINTEGLRAPELASLEDSYKHDNELATLAVGLSDVTIVNISIDNKSDVKDILQIVIHAFIKMKEIRKKPSFLFVHQNVSNLSAHDQNVRDELLMEELDIMTRKAAKMENKTDVTKFSDIMEYDTKNHNWYIPNLWHGVPPMASISTEYSIKVSEFKSHLLTVVKQKAYSECHHIRNFTTWIQDLRDKVKYEKFIFECKTNMGASEYDTLWKQFSKLEWSFREAMYSWMAETERAIQSQTTDVQKDELWSLLQKSLKQELQEQADTMKTSLNEYFEREVPYSLSEVKLKEEFEVKISEIQNSMQLYLNNKCMELVCYQTARSKYENMQNICEKRRSQSIGQSKVNECSEKLEKSQDEKTLEELKLESEKMLSIHKLMQEQIDTFDYTSNQLG
ncbi:up-regulator of cell proliferation-like [Rana temporaria]|uniref:up-regulator of cell proliferation-like n=1 Tax=Rana temporaria TaxID=8407 RepID=UPI001AADAB52|nr:up-regulator of cell proliferation-like [Rana temporaria]